MFQAASRENKQAFEELFNKLSRPVFNFFQKLGCSREDCKDLTSETFLRAYRSFGDFRGDAKPLTWLLTIAGNAWRNHLRDASAAKRDGVEVPIPDGGHVGAAFQDPAHDQGVGAERQRLLKAAIHELPPRMRRSVLLRVYQDRSFADVAEILGVSEGTAKSQVSMARGRLRSILAEHYPELDEDSDD